VRIKQLSGPIKHFRQRSYVAGYDGCTASHCLNRRQTESLEIRGEHEYSTCFIQMHEVLVRDETGKVDSTAKTIAIN
jgi:hypothetical protein